MAISNDSYLQALLCRCSALVKPPVFRIFAAHFNRNACIDPFGAFHAFNRLVHVQRLNEERLGKRAGDHGHNSVFRFSMVVDLLPDS